MKAVIFCSGFWSSLHVFTVSYYLFLPFTVGLTFVKILNILEESHRVGKLPI